MLPRGMDSKRAGCRRSAIGSGCRQRRKASRWARRIVGVIATAAFIGVGVAIAQMVMPERDGTEASAAAVAPTPTATPAKKHKTAKKKARKPKGPTKAQRRRARPPWPIVRAKGFTTLKQSDYDPKATLRVLIGRPVGDAAGGHRAFFFSKDSFLGNDAQPARRTKLTVAKTGKLTVTLLLRRLRAGRHGRATPSGRKRVRFRSRARRSTPLDTIPLDSARFQRRSG